MSRTDKIRKEFRDVFSKFAKSIGEYSLVVFLPIFFISPFLFTFGPCSFFLYCWYLLFLLAILADLTDDLISATFLCPDCDIEGTSDVPTLPGEGDSDPPGASDVTTLPDEGESDPDVSSGENACASEPVAKMPRLEKMDKSE